MARWVIDRFTESTPEQELTDFDRAMGRVTSSPFEANPAEARTALLHRVAQEITEQITNTRYGMSKRTVDRLVNIAEGFYTRDENGNYPLQVVSDGLGYRMVKFPN